MALRVESDVEAGIRKRRLQTVIVLLKGSVGLSHLLASVTARLKGVLAAGTRRLSHGHESRLVEALEYLLGLLQQGEILVGTLTKVFFADLVAIVTVLR